MLMLLSCVVHVSNCRRKPLDAVLRPGPARSSMSGARTLEEVIRFGSNELFSNYPDPLSDDQQQQDAAGALAGDAAAAAAPDGEGGKQQEAKAEPGGDVVMQDGLAAAAEGTIAEKSPEAAAAAGAVVPKPAVQPLAYTVDQIDQVLQKGAAACAAAAAATAAGSSDGTAAAAGEGADVPSDLGPGLESVVARLWSDVDKGVDQECGESTVLDARICA